MNNFKPVALLAVLLCAGCFGLWDSGSDRITGKYIVLWIDTFENQTISEQVEINSPGSVEIVAPYVFAVGHNDDFIIAKQHPTSGFEGGYEIDTTITNYFIINVNTKPFSENKVLGPLTKAKFDSIRKAFKIRDIDFGLNYPEKP